MPRRKTFGLDPLVSRLGHSAVTNGKGTNADFRLLRSQGGHGLAEPRTLPLHVKSLPCDTRGNDSG